MPTGPGYENVGPLNQVCVSVGSVPGSDTVSGDRYIESAFGYVYEHKWRYVIAVILLLYSGLMLVQEFWNSACVCGWLHDYILIRRGIGVCKEVKG